METFQFSSVQMLSHAQLFAITWNAAKRPPCPSPTHGVYLNACPLSPWCHPAISSSVVPFSSCLRIFPRIRVFANESALDIRWPKYWSFSFNISASNELPGLISFRSPCCPRDSQEFSPAPQFKIINTSAFSLLYGPTLTSIHDYWKNRSFDHTKLCI